MSEHDDKPPIVRAMYEDIDEEYGELFDYIDSRNAALAAAEQRVGELEELLKNAHLDFHLRMNAIDEQEGEHPSKDYRAGFIGALNFARKYLADRRAVLNRLEE